MNKTMPLGSVSAQGYVIRRATVFLNSSDDIENPQSAVEVQVVADLVWVNRSDDHWSHSNDVILDLDIDNEEFLMQGKVIEVINGKQIFGKILRVLVGSIGFKSPPERGK